MNKQSTIKEYIESIIKTSRFDVLVVAKSYQVVSGIEDIRWLTADDLDSI